MVKIGQEKMEKFGQGKKIHVLVLNIGNSFHWSIIGALIRRQSESMVNRTSINSAQLIIFGITPVVKQYYPLPRSITF